MSCWVSVGTGFSSTIESAVETESDISSLVLDVIELEAVGFDVSRGSSGSNSMADSSKLWEWQVALH